jgi:hypothetical protein
MCCLLQSGLQQLSWVANSEFRRTASAQLMQVILDTSSVLDNANRTHTDVWQRVP